jgi:hypothetical protein
MAEIQTEQINIPTVSPLAPDFLLFALPLAAFLDIFGFISIFISFGIAGFIVSLVLGIPLVVWMVLKEGDVEAAKEHAEQLRAMSKTGAKQKQTVARKMMAKKMVRKVLGRGLRKLIIGSVLVFFPYWLWSTVSVLKKG